MLKEVTFYYFSPTGGTKKTGEILCNGLAEEIKAVDLAKKDNAPESTVEVAVIAAPVFGGRIPAIATERLKAIDGTGKKAITVAVYGTRAYEDALLELNNTAKECGFEIVASAALIAQHSIVPFVGEGRPDSKDEEEICEFAKKVLDKLADNSKTTIDVPGDFPYKDHMAAPATPVCTENCNKCGACVAVCPTNAILLEDDEAVTDKERCTLCMACVARCPREGRVLPPPVQNAMNEKLGALKDVRRDNEFFC